MTSTKPTLAITLGDPSGIGPEVIVGSWKRFTEGDCNRFVLGRVSWVQRAADLLNVGLKCESIGSVSEIHQDPEVISVLEVGDSSLDDFPVCQVSPEGGHVAYRSVVAATELALENQVDAIVTAPLNKAALKQAGYQVPGHTELLAEICEVDNFAMMLYLPAGPAVAGEIGLGVVHTTLHTALRNIFDELTTEAIFEKCQLAHNFGTELLAARGRGVQRKNQVGCRGSQPSRW